MLHDLGDNAIYNHRYRLLCFQQTKQNREQKHCWDDYQSTWFEKALGEMIDTYFHTKDRKRWHQEIQDKSLAWVILSECRLLLLSHRLRCRKWSRVNYRWHTFFINRPLSNYRNHIQRKTASWWISQEKFTMHLMSIRTSYFSVGGKRYESREMRWSVNMWLDLKMKVCLIVRVENPLIYITLHFHTLMSLLLLLLFLSHLTSFFVNLMTPSSSSSSSLSLCCPVTHHRSHTPPCLLSPFLHSSVLCVQDFIVAPEGDCRLVSLPLHCYSFFKSERGKLRRSKEISVRNVRVF